MFPSDNVSKQQRWFWFSLPLRSSQEWIPTRANGHQTVNTLKTSKSHSNRSPFHTSSLISQPKCIIQCPAFSLPSLHPSKRIEGINSRVFLLEESALQYTRSMSVGAPTSTPGIGAGTPGIDYLGSTSYSYNHSTPFLQASSSESF